MMRVVRVASWDEYWLVEFGRRSYLHDYQAFHAAMNIIGEPIIALPREVVELFPRVEPVHLMRHGLITMENSSENIEMQLKVMRQELSERARRQHGLEIAPSTVELKVFVNKSARLFEVTMRAIAR